MNNLRSDKLVAGTNLRIPYNTIKYQLLPEGDNAQLAAYKDNLILHKIKRGDTISKIAKKYSVPEEMIVSWNGLESVHKIRAGQQLALYISREGAVPPTKTAKNSSPTIQAKANKIVAKNNLAVKTAADSVILTATKKRLPTPEQSGEQYSWYQVKNGDSIWKISRKFNISAAQIKKWNNLKSNLIHPGSRLKLKKV